MNAEPRPPVELDIARMHESLCTVGDQFPDRQGVAPLAECTYEHPRKGARQVEADLMVLAAAQGVYTDDGALEHALKSNGLPAVHGFAAAEAVVGERMRHGLVWGFSGFASSGRQYHVEALGMTWLYGHLARMDALPSLVTDGGQGDGVLGLSNVFARAHGVPSMGFVPRQGLATVGANDHLVVWGNTYQSRERAVSTVPDILVCMGGGDGTRRECEAALRNGGSVLLLALQPEYQDGSFPKTYDSFEEVRIALQDGRMRVCTSIHEIAASLEALLQNDFQAARAMRADAKSEIFAHEQWELPEANTQKAPTPSYKAASRAAHSALESSSGTLMLTWSLGFALKYVTLASSTRKFLPSTSTK